MSNERRYAILQAAAVIYGHNYRPVSADKPLTDADNEAITECVRTAERMMERIEERDLDR